MLYNISIYEDKSIKSDKEIHINYKENEIDEIFFSLPSFLNDFVKVCVLYTPTRKKIELPLIDSKILISSSITSQIGDWKLCIVATDGTKIFISDELSFKVNKTYIDSANSEKIDENLELLILELENTLSKLNDTKINEIGSVIEELNKIENKLDNVDVTATVDLSEVLNAISIVKNMLNSIISTQNAQFDTTCTHYADMMENLGYVLKQLTNVNEAGTIANNTKWALTRSEETKSISQQIYSLLTDVSLQLDEL